MSQQTITLVLNTTTQGAGIKEVVNGLREVGQRAREADDWLKRTVQSAAATAAGFLSLRAAGNVLKDLTDKGVKFNQTLQDARLGVAAILRQFNPTAFKSLTEAMATSGAAIEELKKKAVESPASFRQLVQGFQGIAGAATSAGVSLRNQVDLVVLMSQALAGLGIRPEQLLQESRALITGNINEDAMAARILGIKKSDIELAKEQGRVYEFLREKLSAFAEAGAYASTTFTGAVSNLGDIVEQKLGEITIPIFEALREGALALTAAIKDSDLAGSFRGAAERAGDLIRALTWLGSQGVKHAGAIAHALELVAGVLLLISTRVGIALGAHLLSKLAALGGAATKLNTAFLLLGSAFAGWKLGGVLGELELFGAKINDVVTLNIYRALEAWEHFKARVSLGKPDQNALAGIRQAKEDLLLGRRPGTGTGVGTGVDIPPPPPKMASDVQMNEALLESNARRLAFINSMQGPESERDAARRDALKERLALLQRETELLGSVEMLGGVAKEADLDRLKRLNELLYETAQIQEDIGAISTGFFERMSEGLEALGDQFEDIGASVADVILNGIGSAIDTVAEGIWQVVDGTATWGELFQQVGRQVISGLIKIAIQELILDNLKKTLMYGWFAFKSAFLAKDVAATNAAEAAKTPALAANATLASISSWGIAVAVGVAALAAILATIGAFEKGGVVKGGEQIIRVNESGTEAVLNARATALLGEDTINSLNAGEMPDAGVAVGSPSAGGPLQIILVDDARSNAALAALESSAGRARIIRILRDSGVDVGVS
jgi:hypothetical protein